MKFRPLRGICAALSIGSAICFALMFAAFSLGWDQATYFLFAVLALALVWLFFTLDLNEASFFGRLLNLLTLGLRYLNAIYISFGIPLWLVGGAFMLMMIANNYVNFVPLDWVWASTTSFVYAASLFLVFGMLFVVSYLFRLNFVPSIDMSEFNTITIPTIAEQSIRPLGAIVCVPMNVNRVVWYGGAFQMVDAMHFMSM